MHSQSGPSPRGSNTLIISTIISEDAPNATMRTRFLPCHPRSLPPPIVIPKRYKWVVLHGRWTFIPCVNTDKFISQVPTLPLEDPLDKELVDWEDDDHQDYLVEDFANNDTIFKADNFPIKDIKELHTTYIVVPHEASTGDDKEADGASNNKSPSEPQSARPPLDDPTPNQIRRSDRAKKNFYSLE